MSEDIAFLKNDCITKLLWPERVMWAIDYLKYKTLHNERIITEQEKYAESIGEEITCHEKCAMCCVEFIAARIEECDAIAIYLYLYPELMNQFLKNYNAWYAHITSNGHILSKTSDAFQKAMETRQPEDKKQYGQMALTYAGEYARCPFLKDDLCMIYPVRPYTCSTYAVISDKRYCRPDLPEEEYIHHKLKVKPSLNPLYFEEKYRDVEYYRDLQGLSVFGHMPVLIYQIMKYGPDFDWTPALSEIASIQKN